MDNKVAQTHTNTSNRAKKKDPKDKQDKKVVFKGVLDTPFRITWPSVPINTQASILEGVLQSLRKTTASSGANGHPTSRKRKRRTGAEDTDFRPDTKEMHTTPATHFIHGINAVTRRLESDIRCLSTHHISTETLTKETRELAPLKFIFVCRADVNPSLIVDHLPHLVAAYNSRKRTPVLLAPLPEGAEKAIADILGVRRAAVLAVDAQFDMAEIVQDLLQTVPPLRASWLSIGDQQSFIPTHTKHLRTTAPKDMKAAKLLRTEERSRTKKLKGNQDTNG
ncbi:hypothetical protein BJ165DRAFT_1432562 [Panaeolus papilionaceus]|nr:hypothetical protein BJ165DRAFT_1432562 [Panaeolus papilionaceus]